MVSIAFALALLHGPQSAESMADLEPLRAAIWTVVPDIVICSDAIPTEAVKEAMARWRGRGASFGRVLRPARCPDRPARDGVIALYLDDGRISETSVGEAIRTVWTGDTPQTTPIRYARIWLHPAYADDVGLIEHELGHGLGFLDVWNARSVMYKIQG